MNNKIVFGRQETKNVIINALGYPLLLSFPRSMVELGGTAGWIICVYITVIAAVVFYLITKLYKPFVGMDLLDIAEMIGGNIVRVIVGLIILFHIGFIASMILREFGENMKSIGFPTSPISYVQSFFVVGMLFAVYKGVEAIVRVNSFVVPIIEIGFIIVIIGVMPFLKFSNLMPILGNGSQNLFLNSLPKVSSFSAIIISFLFYPYMKSQKDFKASGLSAIIIAGLFMTSLTLVYSCVVEYPISTETLIPVYQLSRMISLERFFQRIESVFLITWALAGLLYLSVVFYLLLMVFKKAFKLEYYKPIAVPFAVLVFTISLLPPNVMSVMILENNYFRSTAWITSFLLPVILLIIARYQKKCKVRKI